MLLTGLLPDITTDPAGRTDGDLTTWSYDEATGLVLRKTYADGPMRTPPTMP